MGAYGAGAQKEPFGHLGAGQALGYQRENLQLASTQFADSARGTKIWCCVGGWSTEFGRDALCLGSSPLQGKFFAIGPGGAERLLPQRTPGGG